MTDLDAKGPVHAAQIAAKELADLVRDKFAAAESRAISAEATVRELRAAVERAFRDGVTYGTNVEVVDVDLAWETSAVRRDITEGHDG